MDECNKSSETFPEAADYLDRLADARAEYTQDLDLLEEIWVMRNAAAMLRGHPGTLTGWLPSWRWSDFGIVSS